MVLKLDGRFAMVWRDPFSLQLGVDPARVVLREVSTTEERMIAALSAGISRSGLAMIARSGGAGEREVSRLLERLAPLLVTDTPETAKPVVAIVGSGPTVDRIAETLAQANLQVTVSRAATDAPCDLGIAVGHYVLDPENYGFWLRRDLPHLPIIFGDDSVMVGPLVEPGTTPCLYCLEHYRRDADASWSAIASQLWGRRSASETPLVSREVAAMASRLVVRRLVHTPGSDRDSNRAPDPVRGFGGAAATSFRLSSETGEVTRREWMPHPDCGCIGLPASATTAATAGQPESGSARDSVLPTRVATADGPA